MNGLDPGTYGYAVRFREQGEAHMHALAPAPRRAAWHLIRRLQADPYRPGTIQLRNQPEGRRRAVLGRRRLIYTVDPGNRAILIERIAPRATVYEDIEPSQDDESA